MAKSGEPEADLAAANIIAYVDKILALRGKWLEAAGKEVSQDADLPQRDRGALASEAVTEWRRLSEALIGWALRAEILVETALAEDAQEALAGTLVMALEKGTNDDFVIGIFSKRLVSVRGVCESCESVSRNIA
jgi:hypothetical protein